MVHKSETVAENTQIKSNVELKVEFLVAFNSILTKFDCFICSFVLAYVMYNIPASSALLCVIDRRAALCYSTA